MAKTQEPDISKKLSRHARRAEAAIEKEISGFLADVLAGDDKYISDAMIQRSQARVVKTIGSFGAGAKEWADTDLKEFYERQIAHADREMREGRIDLEEFLTTPAARDALINRGYKAIRMDFNNRFKDLVSVVARKSYDVYSRVQGQSAMFGFKDSDDIRRVIRGMREELKKQGITGFVNLKRRWRMDTYTDMAARTVTAQARLRAKEMEFLAHGQNLVRISHHVPTCPLCEPWNGAILALTGEEGPAVNFDVERLTLDDARNAGLFHPNCRHSFNLELPGFSDYTPAEYKENGGEPVDQRDLLDMNHVRNVRYKLENYLNNPTIDKGMQHGEQFARELGFTKDKMGELRKAIMLGLQGDDKHVKKLPPVRSPQGDRYKVYMLIKGPNGNTETVMTVWMLGHSKGEEQDNTLKNFRLLTTYPEKLPKGFTW